MPDPGAGTLASENPTLYYPSQSRPPHQPPPEQQQPVQPQYQQQAVPPPQQQVPPPQQQMPPPQGQMPPQQQVPPPQQQQYYQQQPSQPQYPQQPVPAADVPKKKSKALRWAMVIILVPLVLFGGALIAMNFLVIKQANRSYTLGDRHKGEEKKVVELDPQNGKLFVNNSDSDKAQLWQITPDSGVEDSYRFVNRETGDAESLEVIDDKVDFNVGINESAEDDGQLWAITNIEGDNFQITNNWLGDSKALSHFKETLRFLRMRDSGNKEGQLWKRIAAKGGGYYIVNKRYGDGFALDAVYQGEFIDKMKMGKAGKFGNQIWLMKPAGKNLFTLTTKLHEADKKNRSLDVDGAKKEFVKMAQTGNFSGQKWKMIPVAGEYFRLTTEFLGDGKSLEAVTFFKYYIEMRKASTEDKGQYWVIDRTN
ncbi:MAG: RICIN domain-containing protein [Pyrinomonadaceae bacterium]|nr:RICIN domain-containing protein [Pyrinomonadaceae bacterium]